MKNAHDNTKVVLNRNFITISVSITSTLRHIYSVYITFILATRFLHHMYFYLKKNVSQYILTVQIIPFIKENICTVSNSKHVNQLSQKCYFCTP